MKNKPSKLKFGGLFSKGERASEVYIPTGYSASDEALIYLNCPLPANKCKPHVCKRYKEELKKLRGK